MWELWHDVQMSTLLTTVNLEEIKKVTLLTWLFPSVVSVQYKTTEVELRTCAFNPTGGISGLIGSGGGSLVVRT